jgi:hypothetical protein
MRGGLRVLALVFAVLATAGVAAAQPVIAQGQVWTFKDASTETARVAIMRIEEWEGTQAVHVSIYGLPAIQGSFSGVIAHMPFDRQALEASLETLTTETPRTDLQFESGYRQWKRARGGIFTISLMEAIRIALGITSSPPPSPNPT